MKHNFKTTFTKVKASWQDACGNYYYDFKGTFKLERRKNEAYRFSFEITDLDTPDCSYCNSVEFKPFEEVTAEMLEAVIKEAMKDVPCMERYFDAHIPEELLNKIIA